MLSHLEKYNLNQKNINLPLGVNILILETILESSQQKLYFSEKHFFLSYTLKPFKNVEGNFLIGPYVQLYGGKGGVRISNV